MPQQENSRHPSPGHAESERSRLTAKLVLGFGLVALVILLVSVLALQSIREYQSAAGKVEHTLRVLKTTEALEGDISNAEASHRGYALTFRSEFLESCQEALAAVERELEALRALTADSAIQQERVAAIAPLLARRLEALRNALEEQQSGRVPVEKQVAVINESLQLTPQIRAKLEEMRATEMELLQQRDAQADASTQRTMVMILLTAILAVVFFVPAGWNIRNEFLARQRAEAALRRTSEEIRELYNSAPCGFHSLDKDGTYVQVNDTELAWLGYTREEMVGKKKFSDLVTPDGVEIFRRNFPVFKQQGWIKDLEFRMVRKDGTVFTVLLNATAIYAPDGEFLYSRSTMFDITERKRAEEERDRFFTLSLDLICIAGFDGYFKRVNPAFEKTLGYTEQELLAAPYLDFVHPDDRAATVAESIKLATGRDTIAFENRYRCKDGSCKWLLWSATPIAEQQLIYAVAHDITERKRTEEEIRELNKRLEQRAAELEAAVQELEAFSYSVSHDLRAPLRHISGFTKILLEDHGQKMEPEARRLFERVAQGARQMGTLIDDLLNLSRVSRRPLVQQLVGLSSVLEEARQAVEPEAQGRRIEWRISPLPFVKCAPALLKIVFQNLLSNAVKFTRPRDPAVIEVGLEQVNGRTAVCVRDNGVGFSMKHAGKLFGAFQRLHRQEDFEGTGVGLATVQRIVRRHGGDLWVSAEPNRGAAFYFTLPGLQEAANLAPAASSQKGVVS